MIETHYDTPRFFAMQYLRARTNWPPPTLWPVRHSHVKRMAGRRRATHGAVESVAR